MTTDSSSDAYTIPNQVNIKEGDILIEILNYQTIIGIASENYSSSSGGLNTTTIWSPNGIPKSFLTADVQNSLTKADSALQTAPVSSVNGKTGGVTLTKSDVGLNNVDNVKQYSAGNPPPYPVTSVNGSKGNVQITTSSIGAATSAQGAKADSAVQPNITYNWAASQNFNAGFSALNNNFSFSDTTNIGMEIGRRDGTSGTPYIDFHTDGKSSTDFNSRLLAVGNQLQFTASDGLYLNSKKILTNAIEDISFSINTDYFQNITDSGGRIRTRMSRLFGSDIVMVNFGLTTTQEIGKTSIYMLNQFPQTYAGYITQFSLIAKSTHYVVGRCRINVGGTAIWLDVFDNVTIPVNSTLEGTLIYRCLGI